jgi:predicted regulator of amino acid metabolism with ACT domain
MENIRELLEERFSKLHSQKIVVFKILEYGISVRDGKIFCNDIEIEPRSMAEACNVDVRVVKSVIDNITGDKELSKIFSNLKSTLHLGQVGPTIGLGEIVIEAFDAREPGIIHEVSEVLARHGISIRQAIGDDPDFVKDPKLYVITDSPVPSEVIPEIKKSRKIRGVTIY